MIKFISASTLAALLWSSSALASPVDELISGARKEGKVRVYAYSALTHKGALALNMAFNRKYGLDSRLEYHPSANITTDVGKIVTQAVSGSAQEWDVFIANDNHHGLLWRRKIHKPFDYRSAGVNPKLIHYANGTISFANEITLPAYNKKLVASSDVPRQWDDILAQNWKGKIGVLVTASHWARLAVGPWGEAKATQFVKKLADMQPIIGRPAEIYNRLQIGEVILSATLPDSFIRQAEQSGSPILHADAVQPVLSPANHVGVLKGASSSNTAHLFAVFMTTLEAQELWERFLGRSSALVPGTRVHKYSQGKQTVEISDDMVDKVDKLTIEYGRILGIN